MPTGRSVVATCTGRAALAGNPSDGYGGAVLAVPTPDLCVTVATTAADGFTIDESDPDMRLLLQATAAAFADQIGPLPNVTVSASTNIPRSVGLAGSSAVVIATLRALGGWSEHRWDRIGLAQLALSVERDRLGIAAGLQDRLVQAVGTTVLMTFDPVGFDTVQLPESVLLFVAWSAAAADPSGNVHRRLRRRWDAREEAVVTAMGELAIQARRARRGIVDGDLDLLGDAMNRSFDIRASIVDVGRLQHQLVAVGRRLGAAVTSPGSGGSVVGLARDCDHLAELDAAYRASGHAFTPVNF